MTPVVRLVPTTRDLLDLEEDSPAAMAAELRAALPSDWPPEFNGPEYRDWQRSLLATHPSEPLFAGWYVIADGELVGTCGFKGPPGEAGVVEIGYSIVPSRRRRGIASAAVRQLLDHAFADPRVEMVAAETLPDALPSQGVLSACGFQPAGSRVDPEDGEVARFARKRG